MHCSYFKSEVCNHFKVNVKVGATCSPLFKVSPLPFSPYLKPLMKRVKPNACSFNLFVSLLTVFLYTTALLLLLLLMYSLGTIWTVDAVAGFFCVFCSGQLMTSAPCSHCVLTVIRGEKKPFPLRSRENSQFTNEISLEGAGDGLPRGSYEALAYVTCVRTLQSKKCTHKIETQYCCCK